MLASHASRYYHSAMTHVPRHRQTPVSIRSDKAHALLTRLTQDGRSQAQVIEEALARAVEEAPQSSRADLIARIDAIVTPNHGRPGASYRELRDAMYDENGLPR